METITLHDSDLQVSRIGLGTWAIGGMMWGGTDEEESVRTIHAALDQGITLIDTAPAYGWGRAEEIVGRALAEHGGRDSVTIATKVGLERRGRSIRRNASGVRVRQEVEESLRRLRTDVIDLYQVHWPDPHTPPEETAETMLSLLHEGKIRAIGVSNFSPAQMDAFHRIAPLQSSQPPYNLFERGIERDVLPYCRQQGIALIAYGALCRGLLSGKMGQQRAFTGDDLRRQDPKFRPPRLQEYLAAVAQLDVLAHRNYDRDVLQLAVRWLLDHGADVALWGARHPAQLEPLASIMSFHLEEGAMVAIDRILAETIDHPVGPEFMAPPKG
jgi:aryl-alcohol dehydrogenase-like predicted oxidoreductase